MSAYDVTVAIGGREWQGIQKSDAGPAHAAKLAIAEVIGDGEPDLITVTVRAVPTGMTEQVREEDLG